MTKQQPKQLSACITRGAGYSGSYSHSHDYAIYDKVMHKLSQASEASAALLGK